VEEIAPRHLAESWDNTGLQVGDPEAVVHRVMLALDVALEVAAEAKDNGAGLIVSHHPMIFEPLREVRIDSPGGKLVAFLIENRIAVYAAHTSLDNVSGGVSDALAEKIGLTRPAVLQKTGRERYIKLAVFVPSGHLEEVRRAVTEAGAGHIGNYSDCTFAAPGTGTFRPLDGTIPYIGKTGELEMVEEVKLETVLPAARLASVLDAMLKAHPYEEVAYDLYPLENGPACGPGRVGDLPGPVPFGEFALRVKKALGLDLVRVGGSPEETVKRVAVCGGAGADLWPAALSAGADTFVTGDLKYHDAREMLAAGLKFLDAGHHGTETAVLSVLHSRLVRRCRETNLDVEIFLSKTNTDPFAYL